MLVVAIDAWAKTTTFRRWEDRTVATSDGWTEEATLGQSVHIDSASDTVTGSPLTTGFASMFLREPRAGEGDLVFVVQDLLRWVNGIWE